MKRLKGFTAKNMLKFLSQTEQKTFDLFDGEVCVGTQFIKQFLKVNGYVMVSHGIITNSDGSHKVFYTPNWFVGLFHVENPYNVTVKELRKIIRYETQPS